MIEAAKSLPASADPTSTSGVRGGAESRLDPITGDWTIFAPYRDQRPAEFKVTDMVTSDQENCPFCRGHETNTPPAVWTGLVEEDQARIDPQPKGDSTDNWSVRVVPNKFPAVSTSRSSETAGHGSQRDPLMFPSQPIGGGHEVIIESPNHVQSLTELDVAEAHLVFRAYRDRIRYWRSVPNVQYVSVFKNVGGQAGASLRHCHSQLIAIDRQPKLVAGVIENMRHHRAKTGCCLQCDLVRAELKSKRRIITQTDSLIAYCPFASRLPMLVRLTTKDHQACFEDLSDEAIEEVSRLAMRVVSWLEQLHPGVSYNQLLHTRPPTAPGGHDPYHWSMEIYPRLTQTAGFEWSSQCMINPMLPEDAAEKFRACVAAEDPRQILR